jgi:exopolysaccharide biosynthesis polyprenyl glycosylphosphotransferase
MVHMTNSSVESGELNPSVQGHLDLRAPVITKLRQGVGVGSLRVTTLLLIDGILVTAAWGVAALFGKPVETFNLWGTLEKPGLIVPLLAVTLGLTAAAGLYGTDNNRRDYVGLVKSLTLSQVVLLLMAYLYEPGLLFVSRSTFLLSWLLLLLFTCMGRFFVDQVIIAIRRQGAGQWPIFLIGHVEDTARAQELLDDQERYKVIGQVDLTTSNDREAWFATLEEIRLQKVAEVFVCSWQAVPDPMLLYWYLQSAGIRLRILPLGLELPRQRSKLTMLGALPTIQFALPSIIGRDYWIKRAFDIVAASLILLVASPFYGLIALLIKLDNPGPIFYKQTRIGLKGKHFKVWKFRTMVVNADKLQKELESKNEMKDGVMFKMKDDPRITKIGKVLRRYSLDELPQIFNVLFGEMSLVGPRPFPIRDVERFEAHHFIRQEVLPGITGLWQVSGRSNIVDFEDVIRLDVAYIQNWSLMVDFQILLRTIKVVFRKEGAY